MLTPTVKGRAIYRRADGSIIRDLSNVPWVRSNGTSYETTFIANTPKGLLLLFISNNKRLCRSLELRKTWAARRPLTRAVPHDHEIKEPICSVEIQLLTETEKLYSVLLKFDDKDVTALPVFKGYTEL